MSAVFWPLYRIWRELEKQRMERTVETIIVNQLETTFEALECGSHFQNANMDMTGEFGGIVEIWVKRETFTSLDNDYNAMNIVDAGCAAFSNGHRVIQLSIVSIKAEQIPALPLMPKEESDESSDD